MPIFVFSLENSTLEACFPVNGKLKKAFCYINMTNWLVSWFFHYKFPFSRSHLVLKIENIVTDLPPRLRLGCKIDTRFSFSKFDDSWKTRKLLCQNFLCMTNLTNLYNKILFISLCPSCYEKKNMLLTEVWHFSFHSVLLWKEKYARHRRMTARKKMNFLTSKAWLGIFDTFCFSWKLNVNDNFLKKLI